MAITSISGSSSTVHGVGLYLLGPNHCTGEVRSLKTGSSSILIPLDDPDELALSTRKEACPIQVALNLSGCEAPHSGFLTGTRPSRFAGTGRLVLSVDLKNFAEITLEIETLEVAESQGFWKEVGGAPTWCDGFSFASGLGEGSLVIEICWSGIVDMLPNRHARFQVLALTSADGLLRVQIDSDDRLAEKQQFERFQKAFEFLSGIVLKHHVYRLCNGIVSPEIPDRGGDVGH